MKTEQQWYASKSKFHEFAQPGDEIDESLYDHFLGSVPPAFWRKHVMCAGEAYSSNNNGEPVYSTFTDKDGRYYFHGYCTLQEAVALAAS